MRGGPGSTFSWPKESIPAPEAHTRTRNWRVNVFSKGTLKLTTSPLEILKSGQQGVVERMGLSPEFVMTGHETCLPKNTNQVSKEGRSKVQLICKTEITKIS